MKWNFQHRIIILMVMLMMVAITPVNLCPREIMGRMCSSAILHKVVRSGHTNQHRNAMRVQTKVASVNHPPIRGRVQLTALMRFTNPLQTENSLRAVFFLAYFLVHTNSCRVDAKGSAILLTRGSDSGE